jgi:hypothetical protein
MTKVSLSLVASAIYLQTLLVSSMSFGFSIGDAVILAQLTTRAYNGWKNACGDYANITGNLAGLQTLLARIQTEAQKPNSLFMKHSDELSKWSTLFQGCQPVVFKLEEVVNKQGRLGTSRQRNWDKIRMACRNLKHINRELIEKTASISAYLSVLGISSQGRIEYELFPELLRRMDEVAAQMKEGNSTVQSTMTMTTYDGDEKPLWREFRRDLLGNGFTGEDVKKHSVDLQTYLRQLQRDGALDESVPKLYRPP